MQQLTYKDAATKSTIDILTATDSTQGGISDVTAKKRLLEMGNNELPEHHTTWKEILLRQFRSAFIYLLAAAAVIAYITSGEFTDSVLILIFILINTALGFIQEYRAERSLDLLKTFVERTTRVRRGGVEVNISVKEVARGDVVILSAGDTIPADGYFLKAESAQVDESIMTGETKSAVKTAGPLAEAPKDTYGASNIGFARTTLIAGNAELVIFATGKNTEVGGIITQTQEMTALSAFEIEINNFSKLILKMVLAMLPIVFVLEFLTHHDTFNFGEFLLFFIALAVAAVPEALPLVTTIALSRGALRLAQKHLVPRRLSAIEDIGSIDILCTDKTGTITQNKMSVSNVWGDHDTVLGAAILPTIAHKGAGSAQNVVFDEAILAAIPKETLDKLKNVQEIDEIPFDPLRRRATMLVREGDIDTLIARGGLESIASISTNQPTPELLTWAKEQGTAGMRIMAIARKSLKTGDLSVLVESDETGFTLIGAIAFEDPLKPSSKAAVHAAKGLGITVKIITGDSPEVAGHVGLGAGIITSLDQVIDGATFTRLSHGEKIAAVERCHVFARMMPLQKTEIINHLQYKHLVGFLGEGFNDAPALKAAHVGLAVSNASDMAKDTADIVLLDPSLSSIIDGIKEGRKVFANSMKYLRATLASNFGNSFSLALSSLFIPFLPMLPLQILALNLLSDVPMMSIATDNVDDREVKRPQGYKAQDMIGLAILLGFISSIFDFAFFGYFRKFAEGPTGNPAILQTAWFVGSVLTELVLVFVVRTRLPFFRAARPSLPFTIATILAAITTVAIIYIPWTRALLGFTILTKSHMLVIAFLVALYFATSEIFKLLYFRFKDKK